MSFLAGLSRLAKCVLCIPAICASSGTCFSLSGRDFEQRRTRPQRWTLKLPPKKIGDRS